MAEAGLEALVRRASEARPVLALAPMEGISDAVVRSMLSELGGMDFCVTEFIRVVQRPVSPRVLLTECPELRLGGVTDSGVPVIVQLLGGDPALVAESAAIAADLGAPGIDLNFGCPAKRVNGHDGGAALLVSPERITGVVARTRDAVPPPVSVSAKVRLGWDDPNDASRVAIAAAEGGASWITIHGRTRTQMYDGRADWDQIRRARESVGVPVIANGDVVDPATLEACLSSTGSRAVMIGRGAFRSPNLFPWLRGSDEGPWPFARCVDLLVSFARRVLADPRFADPSRVALNRIKGWVAAMGAGSPEAAETFARLKRLTSLDLALEVLQRWADRNGLTMKAM
jgi:tRNA-dihydrouridine synthase C